MKVVWRGKSDDWHASGNKITSPEKLKAIEACLEIDGPIIVEHWHYYGSRAPDRIVFDDYEVFIEYLHTQCIAGDSIHVWNFATVCGDTNQLVFGKCPDDDGLVPKHGAY